MAELKKYIVESISSFRNVHVVEAENEVEAYKVAQEADDNWQEWLGMTKLDVTEFSENRIEHFREKDYWYDGVSYFAEDGEVAYKRPEKLDKPPK